MKATLKKMAWAKLTAVAGYGLAVLVLAGVAGGMAEEFKPTPSCFTVAGTFSSEGRQTPDATNVFIMNGHFLYSFTEEGWRVQFYYDHVEFNLPGVPAVPENQRIVMRDEKRIPFGTRAYMEFPSLPNPPKNLKPGATAQTNSYPELGFKEIFLPWLALTPHPELPVTDDHRIRRFFKPDHSGNPHSLADYNLKTIGAGGSFLSELTITNDGTYLTWDGESIDCPKPYNQGYVELSYQVLAKTNCRGINFPLAVSLSEYAPMPNGKSAQDLFAASLARLEIQRIDVNGRELDLRPLPENLVAMDARFGLTNVDHMNYMVTNDVWTRTPDNDTYLQRLVKMYEHNVRRRKAPN